MKSNEIFNHGYFKSFVVYRKFLFYLDAFAKVFQQNVSSSEKFIKLLTKDQQELIMSD